MPDKQDPTPPTPPEPPEPTPEQLEAAFMDRLFGRMDTWFDEKIKSYRGTAGGRMGRTTLPEIVANAIFGPPKDK